MRKLLRTLLGIKEVNPEIDGARKAVEKAQLEAYTAAKLKYAVTLGEEKAKFEYEEAKKKLEPQKQKESWLKGWLMQEDKK